MYESGITSLEIKSPYQKVWLCNVLAVKINDEVRDLVRPVTQDGKIKFLTWDAKEGKSTFGILQHIDGRSFGALLPGSQVLVVLL